MSTPGPKEYSASNDIKFPDISDLSRMEGEGGGGGGEKVGSTDRCITPIENMHCIRTNSFELPTHTLHTNN